MVNQSQNGSLASCSVDQRRCELLSEIVLAVRLRCNCNWHVNIVSWFSSEAECLQRVHPIALLLVQLYLMNYNLSVILHS